MSGGKDSLSLLHTLHHLQQKAPVKFELLACTVDPQSDQYDPSPLTPYLAELGVPYFLESQPIMVEAQKTLTKDSDSYCAYCSRMRRGILYRVAREQNCNVVALAQHLDDLAETLMMSMLFGGKLRTMSPHYLNDAGDLRIIRPFAYARERQTRAFARGCRPAGDLRELPGVLCQAAAALRDEADAGRAGKNPSAHLQQPADGDAPADGRTACLISDLQPFAVESSHCFS